MEISNISGPDVIPQGFSAEPPRAEETAETEANTVNRTEAPPENNKGTEIDTYA